MAYELAAHESLIYESKCVCLAGLKSPIKVIHVKGYHIIKSALTVFAIAEQVQ